MPTSIFRRNYRGALGSNQAASENTRQTNLHTICTSPRSASITTRHPLSTHLSGSFPVIWSKARQYSRVIPSDSQGVDKEDTIRSALIPTPHPNANGLALTRLSANDTRTDLVLAASRKGKWFSAVPLPAFLTSWRRNEQGHDGGGCILLGDGSYRTSWTTIGNQGCKKYRIW